MKSQSKQTQNGRTGQLIALAFCLAVLVAGIVKQLVHSHQTYAKTFAPEWIPFIAATLAVAGLIRLNSFPKGLRVQRAFRWISLLLMIWTANGLPFDLLRLTPLVPLPIDWPGFITRTLALVAAILLARLVLVRPANPTSADIATWYGYVAFLLALPYPLMRTCWAFGGTLGLLKPGAAGEGFLPWLACIPWLLAAILSLFLASKQSKMPRRLMLAAGWTATTIVSMIGPAACWAMVSKLMEGGDLNFLGIKFWVPCLFYGSWFLWAIFAGAATRSYQIRSAGFSDVTVQLPV